MTDQQQQQASPAIRTFMAATDGVIAEAVEGVLSGMRREHQAWHTNGGGPMSDTCHACVLIGMVAKPGESKPQSMEPTG